MSKRIRTGLSWEERYPKSYKYERSPELDKLKQLALGIKWNWFCELEGL